MAGLAPRRRENEIAAEAAKTSPAVARMKADAVATAPKRGRTAYYLARLQRDHPAITQRVVADELSVYKACPEAGLGKAPAKSTKWTKTDAYRKPASVVA